MKVRRGRTPLLPISLRQTTEERGQMASTIWAEESGRGLLSGRGLSGIHYLGLPTRLSTKLTLRSHWRTSWGGQPVRVELALDRRGCCRWGATSAGILSFGQHVVIAGHGSSRLEDVDGYVGAGWLL
jgi:hypothetical protein